MVWCCQGRGGGWLLAGCWLLHWCEMVVHFIDMRVMWTLVAAIASVQEALQPTPTHVTMSNQPALWEPVMPFQQRIVNYQLQSAQSLLGINTQEPSRYESLTATSHQDEDENEDEDDPTNNDHHMT